MNEEKKEQKIDLKGRMLSDDALGQVSGGDGGYETHNWHAECNFCHQTFDIVGTEGNLWAGLGNHSLTCGTSSLNNPYSIWKDGVRV